MNNTFPVLPQPPLSRKCLNCHGTGHKLTSSPTHCGITKCEVCKGNGYVMEEKKKSQWVSIPLTAAEADALITFSVTPLETTLYFDLSQIRNGMLGPVIIFEDAQLANLEYKTKIANSVDHLAGFNANRKAASAAERQHVCAGMIRAVSVRIQYALYIQRTHQETAT